MSWFTKIFGASDLVESVGKVAKQFITTDQDRMDFEKSVHKLMAKRETEIEMSLRAELDAKSSILVAELNQKDNFTKRARPTVVYFGLLMIALNYFVVPLLTLLFGTESITFELPTEFWTAWGGIVATWAIGRSVEKVKGANPFTKIATGAKKAPNLLDM